MSGRFLKNRNQLRLNQLRLNQLRFVILGAAALAMNACSSSGDSPSAATTMTVSGSLTQTAASDVGNPVSVFEANFATAGTKISLDCGASGIFTATVDPTTGAFSAAGVPLGVPCAFNFVSSTNGASKCQVKFQDTSNYDLNNNPMSTGTATASSSIAMGAITCDTNGDVTIPASGVSGISSGGSVAFGTAFDFTGIWAIGAYDGSLPTGYVTATNCTSNCHGPGIGEIISLVRFHGTKFTPSSGQCTPAINVSCPISSGTVDATKDAYGMSIWGGNFANGIGACGSNTGFTADEARAYARISLDTTPPSLSGNPLNYAHYSWSTPTGFGGDTGWTQPWMYTGATSRWNMMDCQPVSVPSTSGGSNKAGFACFSQVQASGGPVANTYVWNVGLANAGGCVDSSNQPIMVNNWSNIANGTCTSSASAFNSNFKTNACSYTGAPVLGDASTSFTCSFTGGAFNDISGTTLVGSNNGPNFSSAYTFAGGNWPGQPAVIILAGNFCANTGTTETAMRATAAGAVSAAQAKAAKELLMRYQCYANQYWNHTSNGAGSSSCSRNYNFNWSTNNYLNFVMGDDRSMKPQNAYITDRVIYSADGKYAFLKNSDTRYQSIPTSSGSTLCPMNNMTELKFKAVSASKLLVTLTQWTVMADKSATCQAAVAAALTGGGTVSPDPTGLNNLYNDLQTQRMLFYLTK